MGRIGPEAPSREAMVCFKSCPEISPLPVQMNGPSSWRIESSYVLTSNSIVVGTNGGTWRRIQSRFMNRTIRYAENLMSSQMFHTTHVRFRGHPTSHSPQNHAPLTSGPRSFRSSANDASGNGALENKLSSETPEHVSPLSTFPSSSELLLVIAPPTHPRGSSSFSLHCYRNITC